MPEPPPSRLRRLLQEHPDARPRIGGAVASLLGAVLVALAALGALLVWHLIRRGRLIREGLGPPRVAPLPDLPIEPGPGPGPEAEPGARGPRPT